MPLLDDSNNFSRFHLSRILATGKLIKTTEFELTPPKCIFKKSVCCVFSYNCDKSSMSHVISTLKYENGTKTFAP